MVGREAKGTKPSGYCVLHGDEVPSPCKSPVVGRVERGLASCFRDVRPGSHAIGPSTEELLGLQKAHPSDLLRHHSHLALGPLPALGCDSLRTAVRFLLGEGVSPCCLCPEGGRSQLDPAVVAVGEVVLAGSAMGTRPPTMPGAFNSKGAVVGFRGLASD